MTLKKPLPIPLIVLFLCLGFILSGIITYIRDLPPKNTTPPRAITQVDSPLGTEEKSTIEIFEKMSPSVVSIKNASITRDFFSLNVYEVPQGAGSGVIWDQKGHIVTNFHVIYKADLIEVTLSDGKVYRAKHIGSAPDYDLSVLKIQAPPKNLSPIPLGDSSQLKVGQKVLALGNPFGLDGTLTCGIISALGRSIHSMTGKQIDDVIQTDAAINPGNSGGALLDSYGRLIGINTAILSPSGTSSGIGFAIPVNPINRIVSQLIAKGKITRAGLGITLVPEVLMKKWGLEGAMILQATPQSAAQTAGLKGMRQTALGERMAGDIIIQIDDKKITKNQDLISFLEKDKHPGQEVSIQFLRGSRLLKTQVTLQELE